jgi:pyruvate/2-oxoglutarate dehydrogenase complex dihydrolipoamide dehydrogenase (E3) component
MAPDADVEILVLGGGPAGMTAALRARELGAETLLIEKGRVGGICYNEGPAPVRTLARAARLVRDAGGWPTFGLVGGAPRVDVRAAVANARRVADHGYEHKKLPDFLRAHGIRLIDAAGAAAFEDEHTLCLPDGRRFRAGTIIIATGGHAARLPIFGQELAFTYSDLWGVQSLPERVTVIGGAATGCQLASILADFGCRVNILERARYLEPRSDEAISTALREAFERRGIGVATGASVERLERTGGTIRLRYRREDGREEVAEADAVFFATGWPASTEGLGLSAAGIETRGPYIEVNDRLQTSQPHVYAAGDVNGMSMVVPSASHEGIISAENAVFGGRRRYAHEIVPIGSFTDPEYAGVGLTEAEARSRYDCAVATIPYSELTRAQADSRTEGFCKLIVDKRDGRVLGGHVLGEYSAEVIQMVAACIASAMPVVHIAELQLAYPTFVEGVVLAARRIACELGLILSITPWDDGAGSGLAGAVAGEPQDGRPLSDITA